MYNKAPVNLFLTACAMAISHQAALESQFKTFLETLDQENMANFAFGICNAFAFLNFRAACYGLTDKNNERMARVLTQDVKALAKNYKEYKKDYRLLQKGKFDAKENDKVKLLNQKIHSLYSYLVELRAVLKEKKDRGDKVDPLLIDNITVTEKNLRHLRNIREKFFQEILKQKYGVEKLKLIEDAQDLYVYIHTLLGSYHPFPHFNFQVEKKPINQMDLVEILQLLPVDTTPEENKEPHVKEVFQIAFNFSVEELKAFFSNQIHENTIREGDLIHMGNASHAFFLTFQNGHFTLYDPAPIPLKDKSVDTFAAELKKRYFPLEEYMPTQMTIYEKNKLEKNSEELKRPERLNIIKKILTERSTPNIEKLIWLAARVGHHDTIRYLAEQKSNINYPGIGGTTPVAIAIVNGRVETLKLLAELKANLNIAAKEDKITPFFRAVFMGCLPSVKILIEFKADIHAATVDGDTPLLAAAYSGHPHLIKFLVELKADVNAANKNGATPFFKAMQMGQMNAIKVLQELKAEIDIHKPLEGLPPVIWAVENRQPIVLKTLAVLKADLNKATYAGWTPAMYAAQLGFSDVIKVLAKYKADLHADNMGFTPTMLAAKKGDTATVMTLVKMKVNPNTVNKKGLMPFLVAAQMGHHETAQALLELKTNINTTIEDLTPIMWSIKNQHTKAIFVLAELKANVNARNMKGWTPVMYAAYQGDTESIKILSELRADLHADNKGLTPALLAAKQGHTKVLKTLAELKANLSAMVMGKSLIEVASQNNHSETIKFLKSLEKNSPTTNKKTI